MAAHFGPEYAPFLNGKNMSLFKPGLPKSVQSLLGDDDCKLVDAFLNTPDEISLTSTAQVFAAACTLNWDDVGGAARLLLKHPVGSK
jgi:hypothetical protein